MKHHRWPKDDAFMWHTPFERCMETILDILGQQLGKRYSGTGEPCLMCKRMGESTHPFPSPGRRLKVSKRQAHHPFPSGLI